ncbi:MAG: adenine-specific DNA-methyltransferase, partial [Pseudomonadota bacterium]|nr:adenine-specific DNA-methyltransferase [Pseudomonadota bacterium]
ELNAEDGGQRRLILCSITEATAKEPDKNLCRDVCAERMRRVMAGYGNKPALGGSFAYLQLDLLDAADVAFEASADHAALLLALRELQALPPQTGGAVRQLAGDAQLALLLCPEVTPQTLETLANWPAELLAVYSPRSDTVRDWLQQAGKPANSYSLLDALLRGQTSLRAK